MLENIKADLRLHSMKLAAGVSAAIAFLTYNQETLFTLLALVPADPLPRGILAILLAGATYFGPRFLRFLPQPDLTDGQAMGGPAIPPHDPAETDALLEKLDAAAKR